MKKENYVEGVKKRIRQKGTKNKDKMKKGEEEKEKKRSKEVENENLIDKRKTDMKEKTMNKRR
jgi:hypothetical protein